MKILILGGTQFVGRHIAETLVARGHSVSVFNRGKTSDELPAQVERLRGDRDAGLAGLSALSAGNWDACVDVSGFTARQVRASAEKLRNRIGHYVFISAVSVYGNPPNGPVDETQVRVSPADENVSEITAETYGPLKVTCENIVREIHGERCVLLRPQIIVGPHDPFDRFSYWVRRAAMNGEILGPGDGSDHVQFIDAGDVARFTNIVIENGIAGAFNLAGRRLVWREFLSTIGCRNPVWVNAEFLTSAGVTEFELPLYRRDGSSRSSLMHVSNERAISAGLTLTDLSKSVAEVRSWLATKPNLTPALSPEREAELIRKFQANG